MEVWLFYVITGLLLDIGGIVLIAYPLLKPIFKNEEGWDKRVKKANTDYERAQKDEDKGVKNNATEFNLTRVEAYVYRELDFMYKANNSQRQLTIVGIIMITFGFLSQIAGNIIKP